MWIWGISTVFMRGFLLVLTHSAHWKEPCASGRVTSVRLLFACGRGCQAESNVSKWLGMVRGAQDAGRCTSAEAASQAAALLPEVCLLLTTDQE